MVINIGDAKINWQSRFTIQPSQVGSACFFEVVEGKKWNEWFYTEAGILKWSRVCSGIGKVGAVGFDWKLSTSFFLENIT